MAWWGRGRGGGGAWGGGGAGGIGKRGRGREGEGGGGEDINSNQRTRLSTCRCQPGSSWTAVDVPGPAYHHAVSIAMLYLGFTAGACTGQKAQAASARAPHTCQHLINHHSPSNCQYRGHGSEMAQSSAVPFGPQKALSSSASTLRLTLVYVPACTRLEAHWKASRARADAMRVSNPQSCGFMFV